jgi:hypothetical protein
MVVEVQKNKSHGKIYWKHTDNVMGTRDAIFTAVVGAGKIRNIVYVIVSLVGGTCRTDIERYDGTNYTVQFSTYNITQEAGNVQIPNSWDPEKPIMTLQQNYNMYALCTGGTVDVSVAYWDDEDV